MSKTIETSIDIDAPAEKVWAILQNSSAYSEWNPFLKSLKGGYAEGEKLEVFIQPVGGKAMTFKPVVLKATFPEIRWRGRLLIPGLFDGEHYFRLESLSPTRTRFIHGETFSGLLVAPFSKLLSGTELGFKAMNEALKAKAESAS